MVIAFLKVHVHADGEEMWGKPEWHTKCCYRSSHDLGSVLQDFFVFYGNHFPYMERFVTVNAVQDHGLFPPLMSEDPMIVVPKVCTLAKPRTHS